MFSNISKMDPDTEMDSIKRKAKAVLEHQFGNHIFCDDEWCYNLMAKAQGKTFRKPKKPGYHTKRDEHE